MITPHSKIRTTDFDSNPLAQAAMPVLKDIFEALEGVNSIVLGTGDGLHICSMGLPSAVEGAQLAALNASMAGVSAAQSALLGHNDEEGAGTIVAMTLPDENLVIGSVSFPEVHDLLLGVSARNSQIGVVIQQTRKASKRLSKWLKK
ncbi:hypothetical protein [Corynebacterium lowii]|uniref:Roadblock/LC7 domain protein n=1 Tax=Corynebacterium lowii TaxID=1544413 RepID=A0A0Q0UKK4_9CORY|nr:hypothetical protein [Corynebacterium lowii]KQB86815.1 hypothetical protein Clow_01023 [Corynebacterium lowii]MDP9851502.1 putative regulator of Ras-like GTPase activity (Roadblock/LC7/MglB family) [Corynebacterium lowii]